MVEVLCCLSLLGNTITRKSTGDRTPSSFSVFGNTHAHTQDLTIFYILGCTDCQPIQYVLGDKKKRLK